MDENLNNTQNPAESEDDSEMVDLLTLTDEDGVDHEFEVADELELDGERYVALIPEPQSAEEMLAEDGDLVIMKYGLDENDEEILFTIEDDDEFYKVSDIFADRLSDIYEITD